MTWPTRRLAFFALRVHDAAVLVRARYLAVLVCAMATAAPERVASADEARVRFAWVRGDEAGACPDQRALEAGVVARLGRNPFAADGSLSIEAAVEKTGKIWRADVRVRDDQGALLGRRALDVEAEDCQPIRDAVVLAVALVIDPNAASRPPAAPAPSMPPPASVPAPAPASELRCPSLTCPAPVCPACATPPTPVDVDVVARGLAAAGLLPRTAFGAGLFGAYRPEPVELTLSLAWFPEAATADRRFAFGLVAGGPGICYGRPLAEGVTATACGDVQIGSQHAAVLDVNQLEPLAPGEHLWVAAGIGPRVTLRRGAARLEAGVSVVIPIFRKEFTIQGSGTQVFESSAVGGLAFVGVGFGSR